MGSEQCVTSHFHSELSMTARSRFLAWLIVPVLALCNMGASKWMGLEVADELRRLERHQVSHALC